MKKIFGFLYMNLGIILLTTGVYFFKIPNGFSTGGVSGIGTILGKIAPFMSSAGWISFLNVLLLLIGFVFLGKGNGIKTVYCSLMFSSLTIVFEKIIPLSSPLTNQPFLELCYAMLLTAIGSALIFNQDASSGGTDIVALILKKFTNINVGKSLLIVDFIVAFSSFFVFGIEVGLFSLLGLFAKAFLVDNIIESINSCKYFIVVTDFGSEVSDFIIKTLHHGVTMTDAEGVYTHNRKHMIHTVCKNIEAIRLRKRIKEIDPNAFVIITTTSEIVGRGFRSV